MPVPSTIADLTTNEATNSPLDSETVTATTRPSDYLRAHAAILRRQQAQGAAVASAATVDLGAIADGNYVHITGSVTITAFGTVDAGISRTVVFDAALTLTYNATSLILPGGANITTAAGDVAEFVSEGSGNWRCARYVRADNVDYQPLDAQLTTLAGITAQQATDLAAVSTFMGTVLNDADAATARSTLGAASTDSASETAAGLVELATTAEAAAGTDTARAVTPAGGAAAISALGLGGSDQAWTNVTASRTHATTYTNSTGRPIAVSVKVDLGAGAASQLNVDGTIISYFGNPTASLVGMTLFAIVPAGSTYAVTSPTISVWKELR